MEHNLKKVMKINMVQKVQRVQKVQKDQKDQQLRKKCILMMMTLVLMLSLNLNHREVPKVVQKKLFGLKKKTIFKL